MRDNLLFTNIPEQTTVNNEGRRYEDTEAVTSKLIENRLNITDVKFERVHRVQPMGPRRDTPKPIVAKFSFFKDREAVRRSGFKLKGTHYGIHEQFPEDVERKRRELYPLVTHFRKNNQRTVLVRDRLFVERSRPGTWFYPNGQTTNKDMTNDNKDGYLHRKDKDVCQQLQRLLTIKFEK